MSTPRLIHLREGLLAPLPRRWATDMGAAADPRRVALGTALVLMAPVLPSLVAAALDERMLLGASVWSKPIKFQLSFALHWLTIAWLLSCLDPARRAARGLRRWVLAGAAAAVIEVGYITLQGARGRASHFNFETLLEAVLYYALMGGAALQMMAATVVVGAWLWRHPDRGCGQALRLGGVLGLVVGSVVTLLVTAPLAAGAIDGPGPWVGGERTHAGGMPITGWSTTGGDLRVPHFFAAHLMQVLPVVGWLADRYLEPRRRTMAVWASLGIGLLIVAATFVQATRGIPLLAR